MPSTETYVIVGAGMAGGKAAETLRADGFDGRVMLVGEEPVRPYERPPLSKTYLRGESDFDAAALADADFYRTHDIELRTSTVVTSVEPSDATVTLASGERVQWTRLLLATGAEPRRLSVPGSTLEAVHYLRSVEDSDALRRAITAGGPVVVIGAGWIGCEVAASARQLGAEVAVVEPAAVPLERVLGAQVGGVFRDLHVDHGVQFHLGTGVDSIRGATRAEEVRLSDGQTLPAALVAVGVGVMPRTSLAQAAGLDIDNGVVTDEHLATSAPGIYAAGDVASVLYPSYGTRIRLEHWSAALNQGPAAAKNMLGQPSPYDKVPYFFSDQYDLGMEYRGWAPNFDQVVFRGDVARREFIAFWLDQGKVLAAMNVNIWDQGDTLEALVRGGRQTVDAARLIDPDVDLRELLPSG